MTDFKRRSTVTQTDDFWASPEQATFAQLCFAYLLISPSYDLARRHRLGLLSNADIAALPADMDVVLGVYDTLGDLKQTSFEQWWPALGIAAFGNEGAKPIVHPIDAIWPTKANLADGLEKRMVGYLDGRFRQQDPQPCLVISVPLSLTKADIADQIKEFIDAVPEGFKSTQRREPVYPLYGQKRDLSGLIRYIKCAMCRADDPSLKLWEIGVIAELSSTYSTRIALGKGTPEDQQSLKMLASRALNRAAMIAENAARGLFPTYDKCEHAITPDWKAMGNVFNDFEGWSSGLEETDD
ncbi:hypothetical protein SAMN05192583_0054 [Sphingomonas gellani]|uniref:Uncharacterized protein n=1 Tax=Sphingomonas gellani TaxID=1166340 RepID=A0A1H7Y2I3_9SPHN|nr:hypothetical protein [Sphingomonas gellani]SEM40074.1 hypothetical protein SAMN05192583_0054 [Sphingomonas gellani]